MVHEMELGILRWNHMAAILHASSDISVFATGSYVPRDETKRRIQLLQAYLKVDALRRCTIPRPIERLINRGRH